MSGPFAAPDPAFEARVRSSFARQTAMQTIGATLERVVPGETDISMPYDRRFTQQHGFLHAGIVSTLLDSACGFAAFTLMPAEAGVLSIEYKINMLAPARGERFVARGRVERPGRTITVTRGEVTAHDDGRAIVVAVMQATMMTLIGRDSVRG